MDKARSQKHLPKLPSTAPQWILAGYAARQHSFRQDRSDPGPEGVRHANRQTGKTQRANQKCMHLHLTRQGCACFSLKDRNHRSMQGCTLELSQNPKTAASQAAQVLP